MRISDWSSDVCSSDLSVRYQRRMLVDPWFYAIAVPAVILLGLSKGGFAGVGSISMPLIALVTPPVQAAAVVLPILIVQDVVGVWAFRRTVDWRIDRKSTRLNSSH